MDEEQPPLAQVAPEQPPLALVGPPHDSLEEPAKTTANRRVPAAAEVASISKTYRRISKYVLNMYVHAYISHIHSK